ncbi:uncharacterized protein LOC105217631 [Zeugodacus cucurbitae]|uniref:uncharacterized protein LOC105217631 n=1 Tax=Zeugodacus cucurbitae TaxID=28588 RepID=UPI0023D911A3|nr:uncharacterized protein LOC105217631 [Zeugodacus cucurbitae]
MYQCHRHSTKILIVLLGFVCLSQQLAHPQGYSQVLHSGSDSPHNEGPKIFKALNMDLIYPRTFNSSENVISTTETQVKPNEPPYGDETHVYAAEQPILYVTPPTGLKDDGSNIEINSPHTEAATLATPTNHNPVFTADNEQQQSDAYDMPAASTLPEPLPALQEYASTGRAVDYNRPTYNFNQLITPLIKSPPLPAPTVRGQPATSNIGKIVYPQAFNQRRPPNQAEINKLSGKAQFSDRFTPGEAVAAGQFAKHHHKHNHANSNSGSNKVAAASQIVQQTYKPPENIYTFPPNIGSHYSSPYQDPKAALPSSNVNSYAAAPSGPVQPNTITAASSNDNGYKYPGPTNPSYLPPVGKDADGAKMPATSDDSPSDTDTDDTIGVLPASAMGDDDKNAAIADNNAGGDDMGAMADDNDHDQEHPPPVDDTEYPTPPPGWVEQQPDTAPIHAFPHDHSYHDHSYGFHDHFPSYPQYFPHYPEIIYDDHHHHHDHPPPTLPPVTTEMPPPEPPPEPRVKKYSYFYIGRKLWYIPLYFTVWFSFYVLWLILKSIARHKVNLPNHYVSKRSLPDFVASETQAKEYINDLTVSVLEKIEKFQRNYLT